LTGEKSPSCHARCRRKGKKGKAGALKLEGGSEAGNAPIVRHRRKVENSYRNSNLNTECEVEERIGHLDLFDNRGKKKEVRSHLKKKKNQRGEVCSALGGGKRKKVTNIDLKPQRIGKKEKEKGKKEARR